MPRRSMKQVKPKDEVIYRLHQFLRQQKPYGSTESRCRIIGIYFYAFLHGIELPAVLEVLQVNKQQAKAMLTKLFLEAVAQQITYKDEPKLEQKVDNILGELEGRE